MNIDYFYVHIWIVLNIYRNLAVNKNIFIPPHSTPFFLVPFKTNFIFILYIKKYINIYQLNK